LADYLIDLFFSFRGRASFREWALAVLAVGGAVALGFAFFNDASFDESTHSVSGAPTMGLFLWLLLCLYVFTAISAKRLAAVGRSQALAVAVAAPLAILICGWGLGYFLHPLLASAESALFWVLLALPLPALFACTR